MARAWIALGSNLGDPAAQLRGALRELGAIPQTELVACSSFYRSAPLGPAGQDDYCNAACELRTALAPPSLLTALQAIEDRAGRDRNAARWSARVLDLDLLLYDELVLDTPDLTLPHPQLHRRNFVLAPLCEIAPELVLPRHGPVRELLRAAGRQGIDSWPHESICYSRGRFRKPSVMDTRPVNIVELRRMREAGEKIACLTCYDASFALIEDRAGVDLVLVGDSLGMVIHGRATTTAVSVDDIVYHSRALKDSLQRAFLVADMPFLSFATVDRALDAAQRMMQEGGARMVKLEGGREQASVVEYLAARGVPVCAHLGLQPQFIHKMGAFKVQGRDEAAAQAMLHDADVLARAGADLLLLECIPAALGKRISEASPVPVIGIGAGTGVHGQILVLHDILNVSPTVTLGKRPRFVKNYMSGAADIESAVRAYVREVKSGAYPAPEHCF